MKHINDNHNHISNHINNIHMQAAVVPGRRTASFRANYYTPEITKVKLRWKMPPKLHWTVQVEIHWTGDNPLDDTTE